MTPHHSVEGPFLALLVLAHLQAIVVAWALALASGRGLPRLRERLPAGGGTCLGLAFAAFGLAALAALAETLDHTTTRWLYVNHTSPWNALFFSALAAGIALVSAAIASQTLLLLVMLRLWWRSFGDRWLWLYPLFTVGLTTLFGALLNASGNQIWHLLHRSSRLAQPAGALGRVAAGRAKTEIAARVLAATPAG
jgi:hypothetical protein